MESEPPKPAKPRRRWYLHHLPTCVVLLVVGGALVLINTLDFWGVNKPLGFTFHSCYGWPELSVSRTERHYPLIDPVTAQLSHWETSVSYSFDVWPLLFDVGTALLILASTVVLCQRARRSWTGRPQFQISTLLSLTVVVAVLLALRQTDPWWSGDGVYLHEQPLWIRIPLLFGIGCCVYLAGWMMVRTVFALLLQPARIAKVPVWIWALPWTLPGLLVGLVVVATGGRARSVAGAIEFYGGLIPWLFTRLPVGPSAMTLGHVILGRTAAALDVARDHELVHVRQYERWGPLFVPAYLLCSAVLWIKRKDAYRDNPFEREAFDSSSQRPGRPHRP